MIKIIACYISTRRQAMCIVSCYFNFQLPSELLIIRKDKFIEKKIMANQSLKNCHIYFA